MKKILILLSMTPIITGLTACSLLTSRPSEYNSGLNESVQDYYKERKAYQYSKAREALGLNLNNEQSEKESTLLRDRVELNRLENRLLNSKEKNQYYTLKPYLESDFARIQFLKLPSIEARERWARQKGVSTNETKFDDSTTQLIEKNDVAQGMTRSAVEQSWGEPDLIEVAGNPIYGNERWRYTKLVPTEDGYKHEVRIIYFETARVVGWETLD